MAMEGRIQMTFGGAPLATAAAAATTARGDGIGAA